MRFLRWLLQRIDQPPPVGGYSRTVTVDVYKMRWILFCIFLCLKQTFAEGKIRIQPFHFPTSVKEGQKVQAMCGLLEGDPPVHFSWQKNGESMVSGDGVSIMTHQDYSRIVMNDVDVRDTGNYTCIAKNSQGQDMFTTHLAVRGPPKWLREPMDSSTSSGESATLTCAAFGYPVPDVSWRRANDTSSEYWTPMINSPRIRLEANGSLVILDVQNEDSGRYQCIVSNGIGDGLTKVVSLSIKVPARFDVKFKVETVRWGETAIMQCEASGDTPITLTWTKNQMPVSEKESSRYEVYDSTTELGATSELHVQATDREDNGLYICIAKNAFGKDERTVKLVVLEVPGPPSEVRVEQTWSQSATVRWNVPYGGNSPISSFVVQYWRDAGAPHRLEEQSVSASQTFTMLKELHPGTSYVARVLAENEVGRGHPSESQHFLTKEAEPSAAPTDVAVESRGAGTLRVKWKTPPREQWNGQLKGYYIGYQTASASEPYSFKTVEFSKQGEEECFLNSLHRNTEYKVIVQAFNGAGSGPPSAHVVAKTSDSDPPAPPYLWVSSQSRSTIGLRWKHKMPKKEEPKDTTPAPPPHYTVYYREEWGPWSEVSVPASAKGEWSLSGLREGTRYQVYMKATAEGDSDPSDIITVRTEGGALSDMSSHPEVERGGEETPLYLRLSVVAPLGASVGLVLLVLLGACLYVRREEKHYKAAVPGGPDRHFSYSGSSALPPPQHRYKDVADKGGRPLLRGPLPPMPPQPPPGGYPAPYATMPIRCGSAIKTERRRPSDEMRAIVVGKNGILHHAAMDRKRMAGLTIQETAEVHHYDMAA